MASMRVGARIGKFVLERFIARGGMAEVWAARSEGMNEFVKPVAIKFMLPHFETDPTFEGQFVNEAKFASREPRKHF
jgi:eukaryotic-like serine/threonine-protein kinase